MKAYAYALLFLAVSVFTATCLSPVLGAASVSGRIDLLPPLDSLPEDSFLTIQLSDTTRADAEATVLVSVQQPITNTYNANHAMEYKISLPVEYRGPVTVSAWLNVGWQSTSSNRIRRGDYLTTSHYGFTASPEESGHRVDLLLKRYV
ncbi:putative transmembrane protein [Toxoplasma gondii TgCatPRC2]|uniref:Transmembrane protein n=4 Tax=Toxoplasma gondii TaxID=5811 RepID=A0A139Y107_TOXGO|nr:putative transmembrane protein [Toxoplasma gondii VEG]KYF44703.1 hypothetical protein TGARI_306270 [Toxoplasma gondii ARI]KYK64633.1 putative transmembrane protein [Toxoplasma gondii TgCatPRC2]PIL97134.1 putative transmembrane protein [Toxoplasma gondii COUG]CEL76266.1 TPA: hypothetical protein BN1205_107730 [Toxoplasma gondii VEG]